MSDPKTTVYFTAESKYSNPIREDSIALLRASLESWEPAEDLKFTIYQHVETVGFVEEMVIPKYVPPPMTEDEIVDWIVYQNCGSSMRELETPPQFNDLTSAEKDQITSKVWEQISTCTDCGEMNYHSELSYWDGDDCCSTCADRRQEEEDEENSSECPVCMNMVHNTDFVFADDGQHVCEDCVDDVNEKFLEEFPMEEDEEED